MTGLSRAQTTRLMGACQQGREVNPRVYGRRGFPTRYTRAAIELLAEVDNAHEGLSGPATRKRLERAYPEDGGQRFPA